MPTSLLFIFLGIILLIGYYIQNKKRNQFAWTYLSLGLLLILVGIVPGLLLSLNSNFSENKIYCEKLNESECLEYQDACRLCGENITSSYVGCHSAEFCKRVYLFDEEGRGLYNVDNVGFPPRDKAIEDYLLIQKDFSWITNDNSQHACVFENLGDENDLFPLFLWVLCQEYKLEKGEVKVLSGFSGPVMIDYPNELSHFDVGKFSHQTPRDGSHYPEDIKRIFPESVQNKIFNFQGNSILKEELQKKFNDLIK